MISPALQPKKPTQKRFTAVRVIAALILREMATRYGRSPGGYVWAFLEPLGGIIILSYAFSLLLRTPSLGTSFLLFFAAAYLPLQAYSNVAGATQHALSYSKALLRYPVVSWIDAILARFLLNGLTSSLVTYVLLTGILAFSETRSVLDFVPLFQAVGLALLVGLGVGTFNSVIEGFFPIYQRIWQIISRPLFLASGLFYIYEELPKLAQDILWFNPLMHISGLMRTGVFTTYHPEYISKTYVLVFGLFFAFFGFLLLRRFHRDILTR
ncbi:ABC transporter permease [Shimia aestuarii]|uniref:ABC transporter permease n=1 Tax=Shimia aestuarii TaxID=254406 RepID=UPI001FB53094|nr:ABC transporter permease [Shimia aestuarii]